MSWTPLIWFYNLGYSVIAVLPKFAIHDGRFLVKADQLNGELICKCRLLSYSTSITGVDHALFILYFDLLKADIERMQWKCIETIN